MKIALHSRIVFLSLLLAGLATACTDRDAAGPDAASTQSADMAASPDDSTYTGAVGRTESDDTSAQGGAMGAGGTLAPTDRDFIMAAAGENVNEVEVGKLASQKASSPAVKKFASMMVTDHDGAGQRLMQIAESKGVQPPQAPNTEGEQLLQKLQGLSGAQFDRTYAQEMVRAHEKAVSLFEQAAENAQDPEVKSFAQQTLPTLQAHLKQAQSLPGAGGATSSG